MKWHIIFQAFIRQLYFSRVEVRGADQIPATGPVLALCLHRNGAVDGFVYRKVLPQVAFMIKATLRQGLMGKLFFDGLEVARSEDGGRNGNLEVVEKCVDWLENGGWLGVFPEGTSGLGPRHFPFKSGAPRIALRHLQDGFPLTVLPLGIHYERPWAFRSRVEVVIGPSISLDQLADVGSSGARLQEVKRRFTEALESVGINVPDEPWQEMAQRFAYIATLGTRHSYFAALKAMEHQLPAEAVKAWENFETKARGRLLLRHQGVPLFPLRYPWLYAIGTLLLGIPVAVGALLNAPPLIVAWWAGWKIPDDRNVITLWRILTGVPLLMIWSFLWVMVGLVFGPWWLPLPYFALTYLAVRGWYRLKKLAVVAWNGLFFPGLRSSALKIHRAVLGALNPLLHE